MLVFVKCFIPCSVIVPTGISGILLQMRVVKRDSASSYPGGLVFASYFSPQFFIQHT